MSNELIIFYLTIGLFGLSVAFVTIGLVTFFTRAAILRKKLRQTKRLLRGLDILRVVEGEDNATKTRKV